MRKADRRTDGRTDGRTHDDSIYLACIVSHGKNDCRQACHSSEIRLWSVEQCYRSTKKTSPVCGKGGESDVAGRGSSWQEL